MASSPKPPVLLRKKVLEKILRKTTTTTIRYRPIVCLYLYTLQTSDEIQIADINFKRKKKSLSPRSSLFSQSYSIVRTSVDCRRYSLGRSAPRLGCRDAHTPKNRQELFVPRCYIIDLSRSISFSITLYICRLECFCHVTLLNLSRVIND